MILNLDCLAGLGMLPDNSVDAIISDPPYGLSEHSPKDVHACLSAWLAGREYRPQKRGFMGRSWDSWVPGPEAWRECARVLKPGGHLLAFAGSRTQDLMGMAIRLAGLEMRDSIAWLYGSGMNKVGYIVEGWGGSIKPAHEPIIVARKPFTGTLAECMQAGGLGGFNIDACKIGEAQRWPANVIHSGCPDVVEVFPESAGAGASLPQVKITGYGDGIGSGESAYLGGPRRPFNAGTGSAARFFYCAKASQRDREEGLEDWAAESLIQSNFAAETGFAKNGDGSPRNMGAKRANVHPTVKPTDLMRYLCKLVTPAGGLVVDPFAGSGSTGKGAVLEGFQFLGFELDPQYTAIANARIAAVAC